MALTQQLSLETAARMFDFNKETQVELEKGTGEGQAMVRRGGAAGVVSGELLFVGHFWLGEARPRSETPR